MSALTLLRLKKVNIDEMGVEGEMTELIDSRLSLQTPYLKLLEAVAEKVVAPPANVRLGVVDEIGDLLPLRPPSTNCTLHEALSTVPLPANVSTEGVTLACEVTSIPVAELDAMKRIRIGLVSDMDGAMDETVIYIGPKDTLKSLIARLPSAWRELLKGEIRLVETHNNRIIRDYINDESLAALTESSTVYIEGQVDVMELEPPKGYNLVSVYSYTAKDPSRAHSRPFRFLVRPNEPFNLTRERLIGRLGNQPDADKWTFAVISYGRAKMINSDDILASCNLGAHDQIGICRPDPHSGVPTVGAKSGSSGIERSIKIRSSVKN